MVWECGVGVGVWCGSGSVVWECGVGVGGGVGVWCGSVVCKYGQLSW